MNFIKRFYKSLYDFDKFDEMINQGFFKAALNVFVLSVLVVIILTAPFLPEYFKLGGITGAINRYIPDFSIENGILETDKIYKREFEKLSIIIIDTKNVHTEQELVSYESGIIVTKDKIIIKSFSGDTINQSYNIYESVGIVNKNSIIKFVPIVKFYIGAVFIMLLGFLFLQHMFYSFIFALAANLINLYVKTKLKLPDIFKLTCYAISMPVLLKNIITALNLTINTQIGFYMPAIVYFGLVCSYCYFVLKAIKDKDNKNTNRKKSSFIKTS